MQISISLSPREYQLSIVNTILPNNNSLVVLPTGLGKTLIALLVLQHKILEGKCVILAPTKPLAKQHYETILAVTNLPPSQVALISGELRPSQRISMWKRRVCVSTPQTLKNDVESGRTDFDFVYVLFDEAHRAVGNYAYTYLAKKAWEKNCLIVGLTASPGSDKKKIEEIVSALYISNVQIRTEEDPDVKPYVKNLKLSFIPVRLPQELLAFRATISELIKKEAENLSKLGYPVKLISKKSLLKIRERLFSSNSPSKYGAISHYSTLFNLIHLSELLETQGVRAFLNYIEKLKSKKATKAILRILNASAIKKFLLSSSSLPEHPKMKKLIELISARPNEKIITFVQYRDQINFVVEELKKAGIAAERFVGKREGVTRKDQEQTIARFREGQFQVLVASSIGEEGLDIPAVDTVIFFEPIPSAIRTIQRRGRAGRAKAGNVIILFTENTRDEAYFWSARKKEKIMKHTVRRLQKEGEKKNNTEEKKTPMPRLKKTGQTLISDFLN
ncbi:MAG: helicase-related protein [Candidatus Anstonellales archaeon]